LLTKEQRDLVRLINAMSGGRGYAWFRRPEKTACKDMAFGRPMKCSCYACCKARKEVARIRAMGKIEYNLPIVTMTRKQERRAQKKLGYIPPQPLY